MQSEGLYSVSVSVCKGINVQQLVDFESQNMLNDLLSQIICSYFCPPDKCQYCLIFLPVFGLLVSETSAPLCFSVRAGDVQELDHVSWKPLIQTDYFLDRKLIINCSSGRKTVQPPAAHFSHASVIFSELFISSAHNEVNATSIEHANIVY